MTAEELIEKLQRMSEIHSGAAVKVIVFYRDPYGNSDCDLTGIESVQFIKEDNGQPQILIKGAPVRGL